MRFSRWRATNWTLEDPEYQQIVLRQLRADDDQYRLDLVIDSGNSSSMTFQADSERAAKARAEKEAHEFLEMAKGRLSRSKYLARNL